MVFISNGDVGGGLELADELGGVDISVGHELIKWALLVLVLCWGYRGGATTAPAGGVKCIWLGWLVGGLVFHWVCAH